MTTHRSKRASKQQGARGLVLALAFFFGPLVPLAVDEFFQRYEMLVDPSATVLIAGALCGLSLGWLCLRLLERHRGEQGHLTALGSVFLVLIYGGYGVASASSLNRHIATAFISAEKLGEEEFLIERSGSPAPRGNRMRLYLVSENRSWDRVVQPASSELYEFYRKPEHARSDCVRMEIYRGRFDKLFVRRRPVVKSMIQAGCRAAEY